MISIDELNDVVVSAHVLEEAIIRISRLPAGDRGFEASTITAFHVVNEMDLPEGERQRVGMAVNFRLMALAKLIDTHGAAGWTMPGDDGAVLIHTEVVERAADQPLVEANGDICFDSEEFTNSLLLHTQLGGNA